MQEFRVTPDGELPLASEGNLARGNDEMSEEKDGHEEVGQSVQVQGLQKARDAVQSFRPEYDGRGKQGVEGHEQDQTETREHLDPVEVCVPSSGACGEQTGVNGHVFSSICLSCGPFPALG